MSGFRRYSPMLILVAGIANVSVASWTLMATSPPPTSPVRPAATALPAVASADLLPAKPRVPLPLPPSAPKAVPAKATAATAANDPKSAPVRRIPAAGVPKASPTHVAAKPKATPKPRPKPKPKPRPAVRVETPTQRGTRILGSLHYDWQRLGYRIVFLAEKHGYLGLTDEGTHTITIWVRTRETDLVLSHTIAHEIGHALDFSQGNLAKHKSYLLLRGLSATTPWRGCDGCTDYATPAGDWAEVFAYWLAGPGDYRSKMGPPPDAAHMKAIAQLYK
jgi:hypothetical protein